MNVQQNPVQRPKNRIRLLRSFATICFVIAGLLFFCDWPKGETVPSNSVALRQISNHAKNSPEVSAGV